MATTPLSRQSGRSVDEAVGNPARRLFRPPELDLGAVTVLGSCASPLALRDPRSAGVGGAMTISICCEGRRLRTAVGAGRATRRVRDGRYSSTSSCAYGPRGAGAPRGEGSSAGTGRWSCRRASPQVNVGRGAKNAAIRDEYLRARGGESRLSARRAHGTDAAAKVYFFPRTARGWWHCFAHSATSPITRAKANYSRPALKPTLPSGGDIELIQMNGFKVLGRSTSIPSLITRTQFSARS
jgi:hypothetical protein